MITYDKKILSNGLTVITHRDTTSRMSAVNIVYKVGARNENPNRTGFAHLFEHLMFRGTKAVPDYDVPVQIACGENNAFTNNDYTDFYLTLPKDNVETAFWLESDRMTGLDISTDGLEMEKKVVIEEFNQRYLNQPYGDQWMILRDMIYKTHPYRWATIGLTPKHIAEASQDEVTAFYEKYYQPDNAILSVAGDFEAAKVFDMAEKWFGDIPSSGFVADTLPVESPQNEARRKEVRANVPANAITIAFRIGGRMCREFYLCDLMSDLLAGGNSARLNQSLVKEQKLFSSVNAYITGDIDPGLFVVTGHLLPNVTVEQAENAFWAELKKLQNEPAGDYELEKVKNKFEAGTIFGELNVMNKAMNLGFYEMLGDLPLINGEIDIFRSITKEEVVEASRKLFVPSNSSTLIYLAENEK